MALFEVHVEFEVLTHEKLVGAFGHEIVHDFLDLPCIHFLLDFGMHSSGETGLSMITHDYLVLFDGVLWRLVEGVGVSLSTSVSKGVDLFDSARTACYFFII